MKQLLFVVALFAVVSASAQEPRWVQLKRDSIRREVKERTAFDSLAYLSPWKPDYKTMEPVAAKPMVSMTSVVAIQREHLPSSVTVMNNNVLRLGRYVSLSNGQSWNYGPFPNSFLDARTLSFPMPR